MTEGMCRRCKLRPVVTGPRGRYANLCAGCEHKAKQEFRAQVVVAGAPRRRRAPAAPRLPVEHYKLCSNECGRPAVDGSETCQTCADLVLELAELPVATAEAMQKATAAVTAARVAAEDAVGAYRRALARLSAYQRAARIQQQLERQRQKPPQAGRPKVAA